MRRSDGDLLRVPDHELSRLNVDELLRLVAITRDGDRPSAERARKAWGELVALDIDRVRGIVATFRHPGNPGVRVDPSEVDRVAQDCYLRLLGMKFRGTSVGEYRAAMRTCIHFQCMDHCAADMREDQRRGGSLDDSIPSADGDARPRFDKEIAELERRRQLDEEALVHDEELHDRVVEAVAGIEDERKRKVLEMTREGRSTEEIMAALETSRDNVYQLRRRAFALLKEVLDGD